MELYNSSILRLRITYFIVLVAIRAASAQTDVARILDSVTLEPISFSTIETADTFLVSDKNGRFFTKCLINKTCVVSSLGYKPDTVLINSHTRKILLGKAVHELDEVIIKSSKFKHTKLVGPIRKINTYPCIWDIPCTIGSILVYIPNDIGSESYISAIKLPIKFFNKNFLVQVRIVENRAGTPGKDLLDDKIVINADTLRRTIDISEYGIKFPKEGAFIGFDFNSLDINAPLMTEGNNFRIKLSCKSNNIVFVKLQAAKEYYNVKEHASNIIVPKFGIEVKY